MKLKEFSENVCKPVSEEMPQGWLLEGNVDFDFIESQMMKVGTLAHEEIDWVLVEEKALHLLATRSKDFKLLGFLIQIVQYQATAERFILSINVLADFVRLYWNVSHPFKDNRRQVMQTRLLTQIINRSFNTFDQMDLTIFDADEQKNLGDAISSLQKSLVANELAEELLSSLSGVTSRFSSVVSPTVKKVGDNASADGSSSDGDVEIAKVPQTKVVFDSSDERALRKTLTQIQDFFTEMNQYTLMVQVRRLAVWHTILAAPMYNKEFETDLMPVSRDKIMEYQEKLANPTFELWGKIEASIGLSPYWFDGHYLSYQAAEALGLDEAAEQILVLLKQFLVRIPILMDLSYKGGIPFISEETKTWVMKKSKNRQKNIDDSEELFSVNQVNDRQILIEKMFNEEGLNDTIQYINDELNQAVNLRDSVYWRFSLADIYRKKGLSSLAKEIYQSLATTISVSMVHDWEPELVQTINHYLSINLAEM